MSKRSSAEERIARLISESAQQIWAAGLGALSMAEKEGSKLFEQLARLGEALESNTRRTASAASDTVSGAKTTATETWDKLEDMFELRVARALNSMQIPTARDIQELSKRVDELSRAVDELSNTPKTGSAKKKKHGKKKHGKKKKGGKSAGSKKRAGKGKKDGNKS